MPRPGSAAVVGRPVGLTAAGDRVVEHPVLLARAGVAEVSRRTAVRGPGRRAELVEAVVAGRVHDLGLTAGLAGNHALSERPARSRAAARLHGALGGRRRRGSLRRGGLGHRDRRRPEKRRRSGNPRGLDRDAQYLPGLDDIRPVDPAAVGPVQHRPRLLVVIGAFGDGRERVPRLDGVPRCLGRTCLTLLGLLDHREQLYRRRAQPAGGVRDHGVVRGSLGRRWVGQRLRRQAERRGHASQRGHGNARQAGRDADRGLFPMAAQRAPFRTGRAHDEGCPTCGQPSERLTRGSLAGVIRYFGQMGQNSSNRFLIAKLPDRCLRRHSFNSGTGSYCGIWILIVILWLLSVLESPLASARGAGLPNPAAVFLAPGRVRQLSRCASGRRRSRRRPGVAGPTAAGPSTPPGGCPSTGSARPLSPARAYGDAIPACRLPPGDVFRYSVPIRSFFRTDRRTCLQDRFSRIPGGTRTPARYRRGRTGWTTRRTWPCGLRTPIPATWTWTTPDDDPP